MTQGDLREATRQMLIACYDARRREAVDETLSYFHPDATFRMSTGPDLNELSQKLRGHGELRPAFEHVFTTWDWTDVATIDVIVDGDKAVVHCAGTMRHTPSGKSVEFETLDKLTLRDGKIIDFVEFLDTLTVKGIIG